MESKSKILILVPLLLALLSGCRKSQPTVHIAAAASLEPVLLQLAPAIENQLHVRVQINAAASGTLARQIVAGSLTDLFISANEQWMDELQQRNFIDPRSRVNLLSNQLIVIARDDLPNPPRSLKDLAQSRFAPLAIGDPAYVPAGQYAQKALESARLWTWAKDHATAAPNVMAALAYVQRGECPVGIVYASDLVGASGVHVLFTVPQSRYPKIQYPAALIGGWANPPQAADVLQWLEGAQARQAFEKFGFVVNPVPSPSPLGLPPSSQIDH